MHQNKTAPHVVQMLLLVMTRVVRVVGLPVELFYCHKNKERRNPQPQTWKHAAYIGIPGVCECMC